MSNPGVFLDVMPQLDMAGLSALTGNLTKVFTDMGRDLGAIVGKAGMSPALQNAVRDYEAAGTAATNAAAKAKAAGDAQTLAAEKAAAAQAKYTEAVGKNGAESGRALTAQANLTKATQELEAATARATATQTAATAAQTKSVDATKAHEAAQASAAATATKAVAAFDTLGKASIAGLGIAMATTTKSAVDFEASQQRLVQSAGTSKDALAQTSSGILKMAGDVGLSAQQLSAGMYTVSSGMEHSKNATKDAADMLTVLKAASQGAVAENADVAKTADAVTTALHDYHLGADQAGNVMSKMVSAVSQGKTTLDAFAGSLHSVQPLAGALHVSIDDLYGTLASMTSSGESADQATQHMADALRHLQSATNPMTNELSAFGIQSQDVSEKLGQQGLAGTMQFISDTISKKLGPAQKGEIDSFNQSQIAADKSKKAHDALAPSVQALADKVTAGTLSTRDFAKQTASMGVANASQAAQWLSAAKNADGFSAAIKSGSTPAIQTYQQAMKLATGDMSGLDVALMTTGENAKKTSENIKLIAGTTTDANGNVRGFTEAQETAKQKLNEFKGAVSAAKVEIGNAFLPALTDVANVLTPLAKTFADNEWAAKLLVGTLATFAGAWVTVKLGKAAFDTVSTSIDGAKATWKFFAGDVDNPGLWTRLKSGSKAALDGIKSAASASADGVRAAWSTAGDAYAFVALRVEAIKNFVMVKVSAASNAAETAAAWIAQQARAAAGWVVAQVQAVASFVATTASAAAESAATAGAWVLQAGRAAGSWTVMKVQALAAFTAAKAAAISDAAASAGAWIAQNARAAASFVAVRAAMIAQSVAAKAVAAAQWLINAAMDANPIGIVIALIAGLAAGLIYAYKHSETFRDIVQGAMQVVGDMAIWLWEKAFKPTLDFLEKGWNYLYDNVIKPVGDKIGEFFKGMKDGFSGVTDWIDKNWSKIKGYATAPVKFVIDTVYNHGIAPMWNGIAGMFGMSKINTVDTGAMGFAGGGVVQDGTGVLVPEAARALGVNPSFPGYAPGVDTVPMQTSSGKRAMFSPGEALVDVDKFGGASNLWAINHHYSGGRENANGTKPGTHFAPGGIVGDIVNGAENAVSGAVDKAKMLAKFATDPIKAVKDYFSKWVNQVIPGQASAFRDALQSAPGKTIDGIANWVKSWFGQHPGAGQSGGNQPWVSGAGAEQWESTIVQALQLEGFPTSPEYVSAAKAQIMTESGGNPNIVQGVKDVNSGGNEAQGLVQVTPATARGLGLADLGGNIYDPLTNLRLGLRELKSQHGGDLLGTWGHGHGYAGGGVVGQTPTSGDPSSQENQSAGSGIQRALAVISGANGMYDYGGASLSAADCSGLVSLALKAAEGDSSPSGRIGTTTSLMAGQWPGMVRGASSTDAFVIGVNADHMVASLGGTNIEARQSGEHFRVGSSAASPFDKEFTEQWHLDPKLINPPVTDATAQNPNLPTGGSSGGGSGTSGASSGTSGGSSSGGSSGGGLIDMGDPNNWSLKGLATYGAQVAANALLGNPVGKLSAQKGGGGGGSSSVGGSATTQASTTATQALTTATSAASTANDAAAKAQSTAADATAKATGTAQTAADKAQATLAKAQASYKTSLDSLAKHKNAYATAVAKHGADSPQAAKSLAAQNKEQGVVDSRRKKLADLGGDPNNLNRTPTASTTVGAATTVAGQRDIPPSTQSSQPTQPTVASSDPGFAGGLLGTGIAAAQGAASGNPIDVASSLSQTGLQLGSRAVQYAGQVGGILADGLLETFGLSDPSSTLPGKVLTSLAGAHPVTPNSAGSGGTNGKPVSSLTTNGTNRDTGSGKQAPTVNIEQQNVHNGDGAAAGRDIVRQVNGKVGSGTR